MNLKIGLVVNPIAGMGGKVGLKGTDGVLKKAIELGAEPVSINKTEEMLKEFLKTHKENDVEWFTCEGEMGSKELKNVGITNFEILHIPKSQNSSSEDTKDLCKNFLKSNIDLIVFCGGDGTARDIFEIVDKKIPLLGIPSGVKMHSGVFGINTSASAKMLHEFVKGRLTLGDVEIIDLDEKKYRRGVWSVKLFGIALGVVESTYIQVGKSTYESVSDDTIKDELSEHIEDEMKENSDFLYIFGSGGTIDYIANKLGLKNTLLGIDAVYKNKIIRKDINEKMILELFKKFKKVKLILSPIGAQGFILGRGNLQLSPKVIRRIGIDNIIVLSTPSKLNSTPFLRVDTGDKDLDELFKKQEFIMVVIGYKLSRVIKIQANNL